MYQVTSAGYTDFFTYEENQQPPPTDYHTQACIQMVIEEADRIYTKLEKE
jgi:hypothetical protein